MDFKSFEKIARLKREITITEKIDGTNGQISFDEDMNMFVGSRNRWITPEEDNYGFAQWAYNHEEELRDLGVGRHFGEWWGCGIQRGYGIDKKVFSLFNTHRWGEVRPSCCGVVPVLYQGVYSELEVERCLENLSEIGSFAAMDYDRPEGIVIFHSAAQKLFKITLSGDGVPKSRLHELEV